MSSSKSPLKTESNDPNEELPRTSSTASDTEALPRINFTYILAQPATSSIPQPQHQQHQQVEEEKVNHSTPLEDDQFWGQECQAVSFEASVEGVKEGHGVKEDQKDGGGCREAVEADKGGEEEAGEQKGEDIGERKEVREGYKQDVDSAK